MALPCSTISVSLFGALAFAAGFMTALVQIRGMDPRSMMHGTQISAEEGEANAHIRPVAVAAPEVKEVQRPLGLQWLQDSYENPWQFSVLRTGIDELDVALDRVLERDGKLPRVVVSFTSLPRRFDKYARTMINLLKQQSYQPDAIYVNIPKVSRRSNESFVIPNALKMDRSVIILRPEEDFGPATKLIPTLEHEVKLGFTDSRIVTVDDDNEGGWSEHSLLELLSYSLAFEDAAIGFTGWNVTCMLSTSRCSPEDSGVPLRQFREKHYNFIRQANDHACHSLFDWMIDYYSYCMGAVRKNFVAYADVLEGYKGVMYQARFFDVKNVSSIKKGAAAKKGFLLCDDVWFSGWLSMKKIARLVVNPALHSSAPVKERLIELGRKRILDTQLLRVNDAKGVGVEVEKGLHSMGKVFTKANMDGVRWFEKQGGWVQRLWERPEGFLYESEKESTESKEREGVPVSLARNVRM